MIFSTCFPLYENLIVSNYKIDFVLIFINVGGQLFQMAGRIEIFLGRRGPKPYHVKNNKLFSIPSNLLVVLK